MNRLIITIAAIAIPAIAHGDTLRSRGELGVESRTFQPDDDSRTDDEGVALSSRLEIKYRRGDLRGQLRLLGRIDAADDERNVALVEDAFARYKWKRFQLIAGARLLNWTATEAFHPADVLNSRNFDSDLERPEKLGEPMVALGVELWDAELTFYYLPVRLAPRLPSGSSRLSFAPAGVEIGDPLWLDRDGELGESRWEHQGAVHVARTVGDADIALHAVHHSDRSQPLPVMDPTTGVMTPVYLPVTQVGGTYTHVLGDWVAKVEGAYRWFDGADTAMLGPIDQVDHGQVAIGLEYGWTLSGGADATVITEAQSVIGASKAERADLHPFQRDLLIGYRHAWNDVMGTELFASAIVDLERREELLVSARLGRRLSDQWRADGGVRVIHAPTKGLRARGLERLDNANQIFLHLTRSF